jgi:DNA-binding MarR family transcriptional regulator
MADTHTPTDLDEDAEAVDASAEALVSVWDAAREAMADRVSGSQLRALLVVQQHDGINLRGLAGQLGVILSSASRLCDRLVAAGVLERVPGRTDRREIALHLTASGHRLLDKIRSDRRGRLATVLADMSPSARKALLEGLQAFRDVLDGDVDAASAASA